MKSKSCFYVYVFRHGQTTFNRDGIFTGLLDPMLTKEGIKNAQTVAEKLKYVKFGIAIRSSTIRSKQTLNEVLKFHPECKKIIEDDRIIERSYGDISGISHEQFENEMGRQIFDLIYSGEKISTEWKREIIDFLGKNEYDIIHRSWDVSAKNGESFKDVEKRVNYFIEDLKKMIVKEQTNVAISAHGNSIRLLRKIFEKASIGETIKWIIPYGKIYRYKLVVNNGKGEFEYGKK